jgi:co-chaperonin GroES (HSP10)
MSAVEAVGCKLVLKALTVEDPILKKMNAIGLEIAQMTKEDQKRAQAGVDKGEVIAIGPSCSEQYIGGIKVGDTIAFAKYAGKIVEALNDPEDKYLIINDEDVVVKFRS